MAEYVTFIGTDPDSNPLKYVTVVAYRPDGSLAFQESFDLRSPGVSPRYVELAPGQYLINAKGDGMKFPLHYAVTIPVGSGPSPDEAFEVFLPGQATTPPGRELPCRVYGYLPTASPNALPGAAVPTMGTTYSDGPSTAGVRVEADVWFRLREAADGEVRNLAGKARTRVVSDRHGYFEALLEPNSLYSVTLPNVAGVRYFRTPGPGVDSDIESLIDASKTASLTDLA